MQTFLTKSKVFQFFTFSLLLFWSAAAVAQVSPPNDRSLYMDGVDDHLKILSSAGQNYPTVTIEAWIKICDINGTNSLVSKAYCNAGRYNYSFYVSNGRLSWQFYQNGDCQNPTNRIQTVNAVITEGTWHHVAVVHNSAPTVNAVTFYVDGVALANTPTVITQTGQFYPLGNASEPIRIGMLRITSPIAQGTFHGQMDEVLIWNKARTAAEIVADADASTPLTNSSGLLARFNMEKGVMGNGNYFQNLGNMGLNIGNVENYNNVRPDQTPFTIYYDLPICCGGSSSPDRIAPDPVLDPLPASHSLQIAPNPNAGKFQLRWPVEAGDTGEVEVRNLVTGQTVLRGTYPRNAEIVLPEGATGSLSISVATENGHHLNGKVIANLK